MNSILRKLTTGALALGLAAMTLISASPTFAATNSGGFVRVIANDVSRVYGTDNPALTYAMADLLEGQTFTGSPSLTTTADRNSPVGTYPITPALGTLVSDVPIFFNAYLNDSAWVAEQSVCFQGDPYYDLGPWSAEACAAYRVAFDAAWSVFMLSNHSDSSATYDAALAAATETYFGGEGGCPTGASQDNCPIEAALKAQYIYDYFDPAEEGTLTVTPAPLTITASSDTMVQGGSVPTVTASFSAFALDDSAGSLTTAPTCSTTATSTSPVGSYITSCTAAVDPNYTITYEAGTLTVTGLAPSPTVSPTPSPTPSHKVPAPKVMTDTSTGPDATGGINALLILAWLSLLILWVSLALAFRPGFYKRAK